MKRLMPPVLAVLLVTGCGGVALAQTNAELAALRQEVQTLQQGQESIQCWRSCESAEF